MASCHNDLSIAFTNFNFQVLFWLFSEKFLKHAKPPTKKFDIKSFQKYEINFDYHF